VTQAWVGRQIRWSGKKAHAKTARIVKPQFEIGAELKNQVVVQGIVRARRSHPQAAGHTQMKDQRPCGPKAHQQILGAAVNAFDDAAHGMFLQHGDIDQFAELSLPDTNSGDLPADEPLDPAESGRAASG